MPGPLLANVERFSGFANTYDVHRPRTPTVIADLLVRQAGGARPSLVADVGSGTGLSTRVWVGRCRRVIGIEPNSDMLAVALAYARRPRQSTSVEFHRAHSAATGLADSSVDIVTASQSFHWMEPETTLAEVERILRPGGVFAAIDCDWPALVHPAVDQCFRDVWAASRGMEAARGVSQGVRHWPKAQHLTNIQNSERFSFVSQAYAHSVETGSAERVVGLALSQGGIAALVQDGVSLEELGLGRLAKLAELRLGPPGSMHKFHFSYTVRFGVK